MAVFLVLFFPYSLLFAQQIEFSKIDTATQDIKNQPSPLSDNKSKSALLIGNQAYPWGPLETPIKDIVAMDARFQRAGFMVRSVHNATQNQIYEAVDVFLRDQTKNKTLLFFYAGHSIQLNGRNYLIPIDAKIDDPDLLSKLFDLGYLLERLNPEQAGTSIIILDACRNNPFSSLPKASVGLSELVAPPNTFVAFSTAPGKTADDGDSEHSPYTLGLLRYLFQPNIRIEEAFKSIRRYVRNATENRQTPWENTSLESDVFLASNTDESLPRKDNPAKGGGTAKKAVDPSLCKKIFTKFSLGIIELSPEEINAAPLCK